MTAQLPDNARGVRDEDAFDVEAVARWLRENGLCENASGDLDGVPEVRQFAGGASNLTYLLRYPDRDLVLRRPPAGAKPSSGHDMVREYRIQSLLAPVYPHVPTMVGLCTDPSVLGGDFYVMERVEGTILRSAPPAELGLTPENTR
ncbi:aminoglycoside phosphotransferase (APT) family kinase protein [Rhodococcus sp. LBL1]|nr:aminoglycoside phosphotransferase (APT) family kinase protein [Rhodococcus sp. LBL1]MDH6683002.1 aminoglycoside phosphotransferase (APT) family kinase protein [Rhodococcus sp. LBL2]